MGTLSWPRAMSLSTQQTAHLLKDLTAKAAEALMERGKKHNNKTPVLSTPVHSSFFNLRRTFSSALSLPLLLPRSFLLACRTAQAFELWLQQSGAVSPSRFFRKTLAPRLRKSLWKHDFCFSIIKDFPFEKKNVDKELTHVTQSRRFSRAAMCKGESPWMLTACISQLASRSSTAISTQPENAAQ